MKRIARVLASGGTPPRHFAPASTTRQLFEPLEMADGGASECWRCADAPCVNFSTAEVSRELPLATSASPTLRVCPTDAISTGGDGIPVIDIDNCIGCGLCVARCPVGAIHLDPHSAAAIVGDGVDSQPVPTAQLQLQRNRAASLLRFEATPFADADLVNVQLARTSTNLSRPMTSIAFRLLVRNTFLLSGGAARMSNRGDNSDWAEVVTASQDTPGLVGAIQIEAEVSLDAHRRLLAGLAVATSRLGVDAASIVPIIVMAAQPNLRTDYYRVLSDARRYLNVRIRTVPLAVLYLGIRSGASELLAVIAAGAYVDSNQPSNAEWVGITFGATAANAPGLAPRK